MCLAVGTDHYDQIKWILFVNSFLAYFNLLLKEGFLNTMLCVSPFQLFEPSDQFSLNLVWMLDHPPNLIYFNFQQSLVDTWTWEVEATLKYMILKWCIATDLQKICNFCPGNFLWNVNKWQLHETCTLLLVWLQ